MADYLAVRRSLSGVVLMVDSRLGLTDLDKQLLEFVAARVVTGEIKLLVLLTKSDKLNRKEADAMLRATTDYLAGMSTEASDVSVTLFSALKKSGVGDVALALREWVLAHRPAVFEPTVEIEPLQPLDAGEPAEPAA
jgi:GTP-binding protein